MGRQSNMLGKGLIEVVGDRLRTSITLDNGKRKYTSFNRFVQEKYGRKLTAQEIRRQFTPSQLNALALECRSAHLAKIEAEALAEAAEANAIAAKQEAKRQADEQRKAGPTKDIPIGRWAVEVLRRKERKGIKENTLRQYIVGARILMKAAGGWQTPLCDIPQNFGHELLQRMIDQDPALRGVTRSQRKRTPWAPVTIKAYLRHISSFFVAAERQRLIERNPLSGVEYTPKKTGAPPVYISPEFAAELIDACLSWEKVSRGRPIGPYNRTSWAAAIGLARFAGMRLSEVRSLPPDRVDLDGREHDQPTVIVRNSKTFDTGGNDREFRYVPIPPYLADILRKRLDDLPEGAQYLIGDGFKQMPRVTLTKAERIFKLVGKPAPPAFFQNMRRSYAKDLRNIVPVDVYAETIGHTIQTAMLHYLSTEPRHRRDIAEQIGPTSAPLKLTGA